MTPAVVPAGVILSAMKVLPMQRIASERVILQLALLIVAVALYASTFGQSFSASDLAQSPMFFPRIILTLWIGLSAVALVQQAIRGEDRGDAHSKLDPHLRRHYCRADLHQPDRV